MKTLFWGCFCFLYTFAFTQSKDTLRKKIEPKTIFTINSKNSFISKYRAPIYGIQLGLRWNELTVGGGLYVLTPYIRREAYIENITSSPFDGIVELRYNAGGIFVDYELLNDKRWEVVSTCIIANATAEIHFFPYDLRLIPPKRETFVIFEVLMQGIYKLHKYIGIGAGLGKRIIPSEAPFVQQNFESYLYNLKLKIYFRNIWEDFQKTRTYSFISKPFRNKEKTQNVKQENKIFME